MKFFINICIFLREAQNHIKNEYLIQTQTWKKILSNDKWQPKNNQILSQNVNKINKQEPCRKNKFKLDLLKFCTHVWAQTNTNNKWGKVNKHQPLRQNSGKWQAEIESFFATRYIKIEFFKPNISQSFGVV